MSLFPDMTKYIPERDALRLAAKLTDRAREKGATLTVRFVRINTYADPTKRYEFSVDFDTGAEFPFFFGPETLRASVDYYEGK